MTRPRLTPPKFCGVRMSGNEFQYSCVIGNWRCKLYLHFCSSERTDWGWNMWLNSKLVKQEPVVTGGAQVCANSAERWLQSIGVDTRRLGGIRSPAPEMSP